MDTGSDSISEYPAAHCGRYRGHRMCLLDRVSHNSLGGEGWGRDAASDMGRIHMVIKVKGQPHCSRMKQHRSIPPLPFTCQTKPIPALSSLPRPFCTRIKQGPSQTWHSHIKQGPAFRQRGRVRWKQAVCTKQWTARLYCEDCWVWMAPCVSHYRRMGVGLQACAACAGHSGWG